MVRTSWRAAPIRRVDPGVRPDQVSFWNVAPGRVAVEVEVRNHSARRSDPTLLRVAAAPFGALLRAVEVTRAAVPAMPPGARHVVSVEVPAPLNEPVVDRSLLLRAHPRAAWGGRTDVASRLRRALFASWELQGRQDELLAMLAATCARFGPPGASTLPPDLLRLAGLGGIHWAGTVHVRGRAGEAVRSLAPRVRFTPGAANLTVFELAPGRAWELAVEAPVGWRAALLATAGSWRTAGPGRDRFQPPDAAPTLMGLELWPPAHARAGLVSVHARRDDGRARRVDFDLDADAPGLGCLAL